MGTLGLPQWMQTFCPCCGKVQDIAIQLADTDDELEQMSPGPPMHHPRHRPEAHGPHHESRDCLHVDDKAVARDIARVRLAILLPCRGACAVGSSSHSQ